MDFVSIKTSFWSLIQRKYAKNIDTKSVLKIKFQKFWNFIFFGDFILLGGHAHHNEFNIRRTVLQGLEFYVFWADTSVFFQPKVKML